MKYLGIDLGSSFIKAVLMDLEKQRMISSRKSPAPGRMQNKDPNIFEIPAEELVRSVKILIDSYTKDYKDVEGVIISTQMHGFVYQVPGREDIYVSWQDMRCMNQIPDRESSWLEWMESQIRPEDMQGNGVYLKPSLGVCNLYTMLAQDKTLPRNGEFYTLGSYVIHALTGKNKCHITNAAPTGLADVEKHCWDRKMLERMDLEDMKLPELVQKDYEVCGIYHSNECMLHVHPDYGDMQVAILGSRVGAGDAVANVATGAQVIRYARDFKPGSYEIRPYFEGSYLYTISNMPAGRNLDVLVNFIRESAELITGKKVGSQDVWNQIHKSLSQRDGGLKVETSFYKNPYFPDGGSIRGITHSNLHIGSLFAAAIENMAQTYWDYIKQLGEKPEEIRRIVCSGGVNWKTPELGEKLSQISGKKCQLSPLEDEALSGMYQLALVCSGKCRNLEECRKYPLGEESV